ncbi:MAG: type II toxin-antitoxin system VapC family toxin [Synergistaceae bacterium]|nr:type II toxin-antitoxin system VapC family toxin [Synergistaceae bacterium]
MRILLDTHILLWAVTEDKKFPAKADVLINNPENEIFYSSISIWEAAIKRLKHPDNIADLSSEELTELCDDAEFQELYLKAGHVSSLETLSRSEDAPPHNDPFDRILIAQAKSENMLFLTHDDTLSYYNEPCIICV